MTSLSRPSAVEPLRICIFGHTAVNDVLVVGSHHLAAAWTAQGHTVVHASTPLTPWAAARWNDQLLRQRVRAASRRRPDAGNVVPWALSRSARLVRGATTTARATVLPRLLRQRFDVLVIDQPRVAGIEQRIDHDRLIYRASDDYRFMRGGDRIGHAEASLCAAADIVIATSGPVSKHLLQFRPDVHVIPNGVPERAFEGRRDASARSGVVWVGAIDDRFDIELVRQVAERMPTTTFSLAGPWTAAKVTLPSNVAWLGPVSYGDGLDLMRQSSAGILPLSAHPANAGRSPMKLYEYLATGLPVVATPTAELRRRTTPGLHLADGADEYAAALRRAVEIGDADRDEATAAARSHTWPEKARHVLELVELSPHDVDQP